MYGENIYFSVSWQYFQIYIKICQQNTRRILNLAFLLLLLFILEMFAN